MGLIALIIDKFGGRYTSSYVRERAASYPLYAGARGAHRVEEAGAAGAVFVLLTTLDATWKPVSVKATNGHFMSIGYYRSDRDHSVTHSRVEAKIAEGQFAPDAEALTQLEGEFAAIWHDARSGEFHLVNDRFGARPFYIYEGDDAVIFSSDIAFIRHVCVTPPDIDPLGVLQLFCLSHTVGATTNLRRVSKVAPGSHVVLRGGSVERRAYFTLDYRPTGRDIVDEEYSASVFAALREGSRWRAALFPDASKALALSGGLDSRLIAASFEDPSQISAFTIGRADSREVETAKQVAVRLGMPHSSFVLDDIPISGMVDRLWLMTGGLLPLQHPATTLSMYQKIEEKGHGVVFGGGPGEVLAGSFIPHAGYLIASVDAGVNESASRLLADLPLLARYFRRDVFAEYAPRCRDSLLESMYSVRGATAAHRITFWSMAVRQASFTFLGPGSQSDALVDVSPHLDYRYSDLILELPAGHVFQKSFYHYMIYRELPHLRDIIYANTGKIMPSARQRPSAFAQIAARATGRLSISTLGALGARASAALSRLPRPRPKAAAYSYFRYMAQDAKLMDAVRETLAGDARIADLLDTKAALGFIERLGSTRPSDERAAAKLLGSIVTLCYTARALPRAT